MANTSFCKNCREIITPAEIPADLVSYAADKRRELIEAISEADDELAEKFLADEPITPSELMVKFYILSKTCSQFRLFVYYFDVNCCRQQYAVLSSH